MASLTWSISRDDTLRRCERRYYYQYVLRARANSRDPFLKEVALLKQLKTVPMWKGEAVHGLIADCLARLRAGSPFNLPAWLDLARQRLGTQWEFSANHCYRRVRRAGPNQAHLALFEHEYGEALDPEILSSVQEEVSTRLGRWKIWAEEVGLAEMVRRAREAWIDPDLFGPAAPGFTVDDMRVITKVDLGLLDPDGHFDIFDWKLGQREASRLTPLDRSTLQASVYQLWPHLGRGISLEAIGAAIVYVAADSAEVRQFSLDPDLREVVLSTIRRSIERTRQLGEKHGGHVLQMADFEMTLSETTCRQCPFKRLCQREIGR